MVTKLLLPKSFLGNLVATDCDYYITILGLRIDTVQAEWQVFYGYAETNQGTDDRAWMDGLQAGKGG